MPIRATRTLIASAASGTAVSNSTGWIPVNVHQTPFNVGFGVVKRSGTGDGTVKVEHTFQDVLTSASVPSVNVFTHPDVSAAQANQDGNYAYGIGAVRLTAVC